MASFKNTALDQGRFVAGYCWRKQLKRSIGATLISGAAVWSAQAMPNSADTPSLTPDQARLRAIYQELVEINTTNSTGSCTKAAKAMAVHLKKAGFADKDLNLVVPKGGPEKGNLVARLRATDGINPKKPLLLLAHIDVVEAKREDWIRDPFKLIEENGMFYARGAHDDKAMAAIFVDNMMRYKRDKTKLSRDVILALTCDEEIIPSQFNGVEYLLKHHRVLIDAEFALNEGSGGNGLMDKSGKRIRMGIQAGEKTFQTFQLEITNSGGHSSLPRKDNAISRLSEALGRLGRFDFPFKLIPTTRAYFEQMSEIDKSSVGADMKALLRDPVDPDAVARFSASTPFNNATIRTTCVATTVTAGHAANALAQRAQATVNCRILPGETVDQTQATLAEVLADKDIKISRLGEATIAPSASLETEVVKHARAVTQDMWPGVPLIPTLSPGATDGRFLNTVGIQTYGISGLFQYPEGSNAHGLNESLPVRSLYEGHQFLYELAKRIAQ